MADLKIGSILPLAGDIKAGTQDVSRIYAGNTLVFGGSFNYNLGYGNFSTPVSIKILQSGDFYASTGIGSPNQSNGIQYNIIAKYNSDGILNSGFASNTLTTPITFGFISVNPDAMAIHPDGESALVCGRGASGYEGYKLLKVNSDGIFDTTFNNNAKFPNDSQVCYAVSVIGTDIYCYLGGSSGLVKFDQYGIQDTSFPSFQFNGAVKSFAHLSDGSILAAGSFLNVNSLANTSHLVKIKPDNTIDTTFASNWGNLVTGNSGAEAINSVAVGLDGSIFIGGLFDAINVPVPGGSVSINYILKLNSNGTVNPDFSVNMGRLISSDPYFGGVNQIKIISDPVGSDYKVLLGGDFDRIFQSSRNIYPRYMTKVTSEGFIDSTFYLNQVTNQTSIGFDDQVNSLDIQDDGKIIAVGSYTSVNGESRPKLARLTSDGYYDQ
jgi:uncharacterized delta-60 repeat protein